MEVKPCPGRRLRTAGWWQGCQVSDNPTKAKADMNYGDPITPRTRRWLRPAALTATLALGVGCVAAISLTKADVSESRAAWHGSINVNCAGQVSVSSEPAGAVFVGTVTGVGTATVTASGYLDWPDNDETPAVSDSQGGCTPTTTTVAETTTTEETTPSTTIPPSTSTVPPSTVTPTTTVPDSSIPSTVTPSTSPVTSPPSTTTSPPPPQTNPPTTADNEPFCNVHPEQCDDGLPDGEGETG